VNTEQDDTATTGPLTTFAAALPERVRRVWQPGSSIPAIRVLADRGVDLASLARTVARDLEKRSDDNIQRQLTYRVRKAAWPDTQEDSP
jgi:hypothetical protein